MKNIIIGQMTAVVMIMLGGCGGGSGDPDNSVEMDTGLEASDVETISPTTGEPVVPETFNDNIDSILASKGRPRLSEALCPADESGFKGCYATDCLSYESDLSFSSTLRDVFIIDDNQITALKVVYESDDCTGNVLEQLSGGESTWTYSFTSVSDTRAVVSGVPRRLVSAGGVDSLRALTFDSGFALWELEDSMNRLCLSNGPNSDLEFMTYSQTVEELGTGTSGSCADRLTVIDMPFEM